MAILNKSTKVLTGAQAIIEMLCRFGISDVFGYPGGVVLSLYDELFLNKDKITHYLTRHEQAAVHAAEGYARVSGKCGVVISTSGPGATNLVTGIANAYKDGYPLVVITGQVRRSVIGKGAFGEVDICDITKSCTKANFQVKNANELPEVFIKAFSIANSGKKGPVLIDILKDVFSEKFDFNPIKYSQDDFVQNIPKESILNILENIKDAKRPLIISGGGVCHSCSVDLLVELVNKLNIPVVNTIMGIGSFPQKHKNYFGKIGLFGDHCANQLLREADLVVSLGARLNNRITCCYKNNELDNKVIQIDINEDEIGKCFVPKYSLVADIKYVLRDLLALCEEKKYSSFSNDVWQDRVDSLRQSSSRYYSFNCSDVLSSFDVMRSINNYTVDMHPIIVTEVGQHQIWASRAFDSVKNREFITAGGLGTMGFGLPAAIGASIARPDKEVLCIAGDASFQMNIQELATLKEYNIPVKIMIFNNGYLGMVRQLQQKNCESRYSNTHISNPDFVAVAKAYGIKAFRVSNFDDVHNVLEKVFEVNEPVLVDFIVEPMEVL